MDTLGNDTVFRLQSGYRDASFPVKHVIVVLIRKLTIGDATHFGSARLASCCYVLRNVVMSFGSLLGTHQSSAS